MGDLSGTNGLVVGVANKRSLAWVIAKAADEAGARLTLSYANERFAKNANDLAKTLSQPAQLVPCDVAKDDEIEALYQAVEAEYGGLDFLVHGVAFASRESLSNPFVQTTRTDFLQALDISAYSLVALARGAQPLMERRGGGSIVTLTYMGKPASVPKLQRHGSGKSGTRSDGAIPRKRFGTNQHQDECHIRRADQDVGGLRYRRVYADPPALPRPGSAGSNG